jgi:hypothetical protein
MLILCSGVHLLCCSTNLLGSEISLCPILQATRRSQESCRGCHQPCRPHCTSEILSASVRNSERAKEPLKKAHGNHPLAKKAIGQAKTKALQSPSKRQKTSRKWPIQRMSCGSRNWNVQPAIPFHKEEKQEAKTTLEKDKRQYFQVNTSLANNQDRQRHPKEGPLQPFNPQVPKRITRAILQMVTGNEKSLHEKRMLRCSSRS